MKASLFRALRVPTLALCSFIALGADFLKSIPPQPKNDELEGMLAEIEFSSKDKPQMKGIQIHHVIDHNGNGTIRYPEELEKIYLDTSLTSYLRVKKPIPAIGELHFYVLEQNYRGTRVDTKIGFIDELPRDHILRQQGATYQTFSLVKTNVRDLTFASPTNSHRGKPLDVGSFPLKENQEMLRGVGKAGIIAYTYTVRSQGGGASDIFMFSVDYGPLLPHATNEVSQLQTNSIPTMHGSTNVPRETLK